MSLNSFAGPLCARSLLPFAERAFLSRFCIEHRSVWINVLTGVEPGSSKLRCGSARVQTDARAQKLLRIDGFAVDAGFIMQMRTGGATGRSDFADHLADLHVLADL